MSLMMVQRGRLQIMFPVRENRDEGDRTKNLALQQSSLADETVSILVRIGGKEQAPPTVLRS